MTIKKLIKELEVYDLNEEIFIEVKNKEYHDILNPLNEVSKYRGRIRLTGSIEEIDAEMGPLFEPD